MPGMLRLDAFGTGGTDQGVDRDRTHDLFGAIPVDAADLAASLLGEDQRPVRRERDVPRRVQAAEDEILVEGGRSGRPRGQGRWRRRQLWWGRRRRTVLRRYTRRRANGQGHKGRNEETLAPG
jgi:hypothetical protein